MDDVERIARLAGCTEKQVRRLLMVAGGISIKHVAEHEGVSPQAVFDSREAAVRRIRRHMKESLEP